MPATVSTAEQAPARPAALEATVAQWLTHVEREEAGPALVPVSHAEEAVRVAWDAVASRWPATAGTRKRIVLVTRRAQALVEGPRSRIARAARLAPRPWLADEGPLARILEQASALAREVADLAAVVDRARAMRDELRDLGARYATELPRAWERMVVRRRVTEEEIDLARSAEELDAIAFWLRRASDGLAGWQAELSAWVAKAGSDTGPGNAIDDTAGALPPLAALETRYELLLTIAAVDRAPALQRNAMQLRSSIHRHLGVVASAARLGSEDAILRCAREYGESQTSAAIGAEEAWTYAEALSHYGRLRAERRRSDGDG
jgi:hypothetical protein